ncbi:MAG: PIN domain-containing protein [Candidatus Micrarchaeota archaeon]
MRIVVDANIFVSALLKDSVTRRLLKHPFLEFYTVDFVRTEFDEHLNEFCERSGLSKPELTTLINGLMKGVRIVATSEFKHQINAASKLIDDVDDVPYLALALALGKDAVIWSNDTAFGKQKAVKVFTTKGMLEAARQ